MVEISKTIVIQINGIIDQGERISVLLFSYSSGILLFENTLPVSPVLLAIMASWCCMCDSLYNRLLCLFFLSGSARQPIRSGHVSGQISTQADPLHYLFSVLCQLLVAKSIASIGFWQSLATKRLFLLMVLFLF